jgi:hypothetical protein
LSLVGSEIGIYETGMDRKRDVQLSKLGRGIIKQEIENKNKIERGRINWGGESRKEMVQIEYRRNHAFGKNRRLDKLG